MLKIRRSHDRLIFNMGIPIPGKDGLYIEAGPRLNGFPSWNAILEVAPLLLANCYVNSLIPERCTSNFKSIIFKLIVQKMLFGHSV